MSEPRTTTVRVSMEAYQILKQAAVKYQVPLPQALDLLIEEWRQKTAENEKRLETATDEIARLKARVEALEKELKLKEEMLKASHAPQQPSQKSARIKPLTEKQALRLLRGTRVKGQMGVISTVYQMGYALVQRGGSTEKGSAG